MLLPGSCGAADLEHEADLSRCLEKLTKKLTKRCPNQPIHAQNGNAP